MITNMNDFNTLRHLYMLRCYTSDWTVACSVWFLDMLMVRELFKGRVYFIQLEQEEQCRNNLRAERIQGITVPLSACRCSFTQYGFAYVYYTARYRLFYNVNFSELCKTDACAQWLWLLRCVCRCKKMVSGDRCWVHVGAVSGTLRTEYRPNIETYVNGSEWELHGQWLPNVVGLENEYQVSKV